MKGIFPSPLPNAADRLGEAKAWALVASTGKLRAGFNVAGVVRNGTGDYTVTLQRAFQTGAFGTLATAQTHVGIGSFVFAAVHNADVGNANQRRIAVMGSPDGAAVDCDFFAAFYGEQV